jgi:outer membrane cobalamin receptor
MKPLRYAPENMFSASGSLTLEPVYLNFQVNHLGERLTLYSWPKDLFLPAVNIYSCSLTYRFKIKTHEIYCVFLVDNLTNQSYETIQGYPEPGRTWRLTVTYQFK